MLNNTNILHHVSAGITRHLFSRHAFIYFLAEHWWLPQDILQDMANSMDFEENMNLF